MDTKHLRYYIEIVEKGNISKAAESLFIAQPALSIVLKKMEEDLGTTLILRQKKKWEITEAGRLFYTYAKQTVNELDYLKNQFEEIEKGNVGNVKIGVASSCTELLTEYLAMFCEQYPDVKITIINGDTEEIQRKLDEREIDVALILKVQELEKYKSKNLKPIPCYACIPKSWGWVERHSIKLEDFNNKRFIMLEPMKNVLYEQELHAAFITKNIYPVKIICCKDITMVLQMVTKGLGAAIVPNIDMNSVYKHEIDFIKIENYDYNISPVMISLKNKPISKAAEAFWNYVD
jgi:LysR family transcriptional regulator, salicylic acid-responsive activator of bsdBCD